ncbi:phosphatase PAP2 family protein [Pseudorhodoferax sp.]|uniref:phosphatase PAP2 family protein n=1 Tax=Pseudorhodoferax sp. TaxID=1993553 RepID=UPI002DD6AB01|nr:phosphatase PAP2 family protein [Pseudorhodoferax sp.]
MDPPAPGHWRAELVYRVRKLFWLKLLGTTLWTTLFFVGYFHLLRHPAYPVAVMPLTWVDRLVPFQPAMLWPYLSLWFYIGIAPGLQRDFRQLLAYGLWTIVLMGSGLLIFHFWPTAVPPLSFDRAGYPGFALLEGVDGSGNASPSMHVASAVFTGLRLHAALREIGAPVPLRLANGVWAGLIAWSTVAVRQHVALDVLGGAALGLVVAALSLRWRPATGYHPARP